MTIIDFEYADRTGLTLTAEQSEEMKHKLASFYDAIEKAVGHPDQYCSTGIDGGFADTVRLAYAKTLAGHVLTDFHMVGMILHQMPAYWPPRYRASIAYFLSPLCAYYFEDTGSPANVLAGQIRGGLNIPVHGG